MGIRTPEQRVAYSGAKDTPTLPFAETIVAQLPKPRMLIRLGIAALVAALAMTHRQQLLAVLPSYLRKGSLFALKVLNAVSQAILNVITSPLAISVGSRLMTRLVDWGVPAAVVLATTAVAASGDDAKLDAAEPADSKNGGLLKKLLAKSSGSGSPGAAPSKEYIRIDSLSEKLSSMAYTIEANTLSKAEAARTQRRRNLSRRFSDELGDIGEAALAGIAAAEKAWRKEVAKPAAAAKAARAELRELSVELGGAIQPRSTLGDRAKLVDGAAARSKKERALKRKMKRAEEDLADAMRASAELETTFLRVASEALGEDAWEARQALAKLAVAPTSWDPMDLPLPHQRLNAGDRAFVIDFQGDTEPKQVMTLREEVTAVINSAATSRGETRVVLRLISGGGSVTGYGLAMAQLLRLKSAGIHLTVCVEQVAASGGYMMACVADCIVASPFAVLGSIGVITQIPNVYERLQKEGVQFQTVTAGEFKRTLTPFKKVDPKDVEKTKEEIGEIFALFKNFVREQRPQLDIDKVATGETWFGKDAVDLKLADGLQTFDDLLLELHRDGVEVYSVAYQLPEENPLTRLKIGSTALGGSAAPNNWATRLLVSILGMPVPQPQLPYEAKHQQQPPHFCDPRFA